MSTTTNEWILFFIIIAMACSMIAITIVLANIIKKRNKEIEKLQDHINSFVTETNEYIDTVKHNIPKMDLSSRLSYTDELLVFISNLVDIELMNSKRFEIFLNSEANDLDVDKNIEEISLIVFNGITPTLFTDPDNILTKEYLMSYIQKMTCAKVIQYIQKKMENRM